MKTFVINLNHRKDRLDRFLKDWSNFDLDLNIFKAIQPDEVNNYHVSPYNDWEDPLLNRKLLNGEIACFLSHYKLWEHCIDINENILIMEDDVYPVEPFHVEDFSRLPKGRELLYLSFLEMNLAYQRKLDNKFVIPAYPYWACAYVLTPHAAKKLVNTDILRNIIPVDEYLPIMLGGEIPEEFKKERFIKMVERLKRFEKISGIGAASNLVLPHDRKEMGSDIENTSEIEVHKNLEFNSITPKKLKVVTVATEREKAEKLERTCIHYGHNLYIFGNGKDWLGGDMEGGRGGFHKVQIFSNYLHKEDYFHDDDVVLFVDGYDTFITATPEEILERFENFDADIVFSAEKNCWPDQSIANEYPPARTPYRFLNSGGYIGRVSAIKALLNDVDYYSSDYDDQWYFHLKFLMSRNSVGANLIGDIKVVLDDTTYIFQTLAGTNVNEIYVHDNKDIVNDLNKCAICVVHGNGGAPLIDELYNEVFSDINLPLTEYQKDLSYTKKEAKDVIEYNEIVFEKPELVEVGPDILSSPFLNNEACNEIIVRAEKHGKWDSLPEDAYPGKELRIKDFWPEMHYEIEQHLMKNFFPMLEEYWHPLYFYGVRDIFLIRYSTDTQKSLDCHHDASMVSFSIKLNDNYEGAELYFHRQDFSNKNIPVGHFISWPSQVTHGHECTEIVNGIKYSLTIWTSRFPDDKN